MGDLDSFYRMTPFEVAVGWIFGVDEVPARPDRDGLSAREAFEQVVLEALQAEGPTFVTFSGGRDSSAVLAVAGDQARRHGLEMPVPVTNRYPDVDSAEESEWQELVIRHLGVSDWMKIERDEDDDLLGEAAQESLRRFGLLWPPTVHLLGPLLAATRGGMVLTGEGGDEVFDPRRITPLTGLIRRNVSPRKTAALAALKELAPRGVRRQLLRADVASDAERSWLTPDCQARLLREMIDEQLNDPLHWGRGVERVPCWRALRFGLRNRALVAAAGEVTLVHPFHEPLFVHSWAEEGGALGYPGRTVAMKKLFGHLLPDVLLARRTKARFNDAYVRGPAREFATSWNGLVENQEMVIAEALREELLSPEPHASTLTLLHAAWLQESSPSS